MAKRSFSYATWTPTAVADTVNMTNGNYMALQGGTSTQRLNVIEIYININYKDYKNYKKKK